MKKEIEIREGAINVIIEKNGETYHSTIRLGARKYMDEDGIRKLLNEVIREAEGMDLLTYKE